MSFKERVLKMIAYHLQVAESKAQSVREENKQKYYGIKVATLRDIYDDVKAMDERVGFYGNNRSKN